MSAIADCPPKADLQLSTPERSLAVEFLWAPGEILSLAISFWSDRGGTAIRELESALRIPRDAAVRRGHAATIKAVGMFVKRQKWMSVIAAAAVAAVGLGFWLHLNSPRYCAAEGRVIPEDEWKVRALMALRQEDEEHLSQNIRDFLRRRVPSGGSNAEIRIALEDYVHRVPLCCQVDYNDTANFREHEEQFTDGRILFEKKPVADVYLFEGKETDFIERRFKKGVRSIAPGNVILPTIFGVSSCGDEVIVWGRG